MCMYGHNVEFQPSKSWYQYNAFKPSVAWVAVRSKAPIVGFCVCSVFCCALLCVLSSFAIILMGKRELIALLCFGLSGVWRLFLFCGSYGVVGWSAVCDCGIS